MYYRKCAWSMSLARSARCIASRAHVYCCVRTVCVCSQQPAWLSAQSLNFGRSPFLSNVGSNPVGAARQYCDELKPEKKKVEFVLLVSSDDKVLGTKTKDEALAFAKKHDYHLVRLEEDKHAEAKKRKVYKLMSSQQMLEHEEEGADSREVPQDAPKQQHAVKNVIASSKITENDLTTKLKSVKKWLDKKCEIRVGITGTPDSTKQLDAIYEKFEAFLGSEARFLQKRIKNGVLKFVILPPSEKKNKAPKPASKQPAADEG